MSGGQTQLKLSLGFSRSIQLLIDGRIGVIQLDEGGSRIGIALDDRLGIGGNGEGGADLVSSRVSNKISCESRKVLFLYVHIFTRCVRENRRCQHTCCSRTGNTISRSGNLKRRVTPSYCTFMVTSMFGPGPFWRASDIASSSSLSLLVCFLYHRNISVNL